MTHGLFLVYLSRRQAQISGYINGLLRLSANTFFEHLYITEKSVTLTESATQLGDSGRFDYHLP